MTLVETHPADRFARDRRDLSRSRYAAVIAQIQREALQEMSSCLRLVPAAIC